MYDEKSGRTYRVPDLRKDEEDLRDFKYKDVLKIELEKKQETSLSMPSKVDYSHEMTPVKSQGYLGCHDNQTEVLTDEGWKKFNLLNKKELLATVNTLTNRMEYQKPINYVHSQYDGDMYHFNHKRGIDCLVTPNHRMYIDKNGKNDFSFIRADNIAHDSSVSFLGWNEDSGNIKDSICMKKEDINVIPYKGDAFCAEVPNHTLVTRRNGKVMVSGNSCVAFAVSAMKEWQEAKEHKQEIKEGKTDHRKNKVYDYSEAWIYWNCKKIDQWPDSEGTSIKAGFKVLNKIGVPCEDGWVYDDEVKGEPKKWAHLVARWALAGSYYRLNTIEEMEMALYKQGPIVIGFACFEEIMNSKFKDGIIPYPANPNISYGGHAVCVTGFDSERQLFKIKNSWSKYWNLDGYGYLPYKYIKSFLWDAWTCDDIKVTREMLKGAKAVLER